MVQQIKSGSKKKSGSSPHKRGEGTSSPKINEKKASEGLAANEARSVRSASPG